VKGFLAFAAALLLGACAAGSGRVETLSQAPSFRAKALAIATVRGGRESGPAIAREAARLLTAGGLPTSVLEDSDSVLAGSALGLDVAGNPRVLAEIRRATGADAVVFLALDPSWRTLDAAALDLATGDPVLRATARPRGDAFASAREAAAAAAEALSSLAPERARAAAAARDGIDEIPVP
jgi:hypothetical protein